MKKKGLIALAIAVVLAAMPAVAGAANSVSGSGSHSSSGGSGGGGSSSTSTGTVVSVGSGTVTGTAVNTGSVVEVAANGEKITLVNKGTDSTGTTMSIVVEIQTSAGVAVTEAANGGAAVGAVNVSIASGAAETAGLPADVVDTITSLNGGADIASVVPAAAGYTSVGGTRAIIAKDAAGADAPAEISMKVDSLVGANGVMVVYYNNNSGTWEVAQNVRFDAATGVVTFTVPGSVTVKFAKK